MFRWLQRRANKREVRELTLREQDIDRFRMWCIEEDEKAKKANNPKDGAD
jgi:hypothetical protein